MDSPGKEPRRGIDAGVSMLELLIVVALITIVSSFALISFQKSSKDFEDEALTCFVVYALVIELHHIAVDTHVRRRARRQMKVRSTLQLHLSEEVIKSGHN